MTREEKQKAIDALKMSVPIKALTQEEFNDYIQTLNKIMNWLEQDPICETLTSGYVQEIRFPAEKVGRWIHGEDLGTGRDGWYCNQCGHFEFWDYSSDSESAELNLPNFCPNCGAKMQKVTKETTERTPTVSEPKQIERSCKNCVHNGTDVCIEHCDDHWMHCFKPKTESEDKNGNI